MKSLASPDWSVPQRQASAGVLVILYKSLLLIIRVIWPLLLVFLFRESDKRFGMFEVFLTGIPAMILIRSLVEFYFFRFSIQAGDLIIKKGFLSKKVVTIPLTKIQSVQIEQNLVHKIFDVAKIAIDTAGSEKSEAEIDAISVEKAERFKEFLLDKKDPGLGDINALPEHERVPVIRLSTTDILKLGLSANHLRAFLIVLAFAISALQDLSEIFGNRVILFVEESSSAIGVSLASIAVVMVFVLGLSIIVSVARIILKYSNFTCSETDQGLRIRTGLIDSKQHLVPFNKIQFVSWEANWVRKMIGLFMLEIHQAQNEQARKKQRIRIPVPRTEHINRLLDYYHPSVVPLAHSTHKINTVYALRQMLFSGVPLAVMVTFLMYFWLSGYALLFLIIAPYVYATSVIYQRKFRVFISPEALQVNSGAWGMKSQVAQWYKIQYMQLNQSIFQRRKNLATIIIHTAAGQIMIPYIDLELAHKIHNYAVFKVESSGRWWI